MSDNDFTTSSLSERVARRTYLITCSQVNLSKFPTRESFGQCVSSAFISEKSEVTVQHWACCKELHKDGGSHYHMSIKLSGPKRWLAAKKSVQESHGAVLHFSKNHDNYYSAYRYLSKTDKNITHSKGHPNLEQIGSPRTKKCISAYREKRKLARASNEHKNNKKSKMYYF